MRQRMAAGALLAPLRVLATGGPVGSACSRAWSTRRCKVAESAMGDGLLHVVRIDPVQRQTEPPKELDSRRREGVEVQFHPGARLAAGKRARGAGTCTQQGVHAGP